MKMLKPINAYLSHIGTTKHNAIGLQISIDSIHKKYELNVCFIWRLNGITFDLFLIQYHEYNINTFNYSENLYEQIIFIVIALNCYFILQKEFSIFFMWKNNTILKFCFCSLKDL